MVNAPFRWEPIGEHLDGNIAAQYVELLEVLNQSDDVAMPQPHDGMSQLERELLQIFQGDHHQLEQFVDWLLAQLYGPTDDDAQMCLDAEPLSNSE